MEEVHKSMSLSIVGILGYTSSEPFGPTFSQRRRPFLFNFACFVILQRVKCFACKRVQHEDVKYGHEDDADIAEVSHESVGCKAAEKEHGEGDDFIYCLPCPGVSEDVRDV